jgi:Cu+-exporting ATPase
MGWAGRRFYVKAWASVRHGAADMNVLVALGTGAAFLYSAAATLAPGFFAARGLPAEVYYEGALFILGFILTGNALESRARRRTSAALRGLAALEPPAARVERQGVELELPLESLVAGDLLLVRPGERFAADGVVEAGASAVDESMLTGEPIPVDKQPGDRVTAGALNVSGSLRVRATAIGAETVLEQIVRLLRGAQGQRAPIQRLADRISAVFVPAVILVALVTLAAWLWLKPAAPLQGFRAAVSVLIIACPCAMGLAVPAAVLVATGQAARLGLLVKGGDTLERLARADTAAFDKTGTLTEGQPEVVGFTAGEGEDRQRTLGLAAALERESEHPLAAALVRYAESAGAPAVRAEEFQDRAGFGVTGRAAGERVMVGRRELLEEAGVDCSAFPAPARSALWVALEGRCAAVAELADRARPSARAALAGLRRQGLRLVMVTGDHQAAARTLAAELGIEEVAAGLRPEGKVETIRRLQADGRVVAMAGDGINDAPALAAADVGLAMASGSDIARHASDVTLLREDLRGFAAAVRLARRALKVMRQNLFWAFLYNILAIPAAAAGLLNPVLAGAAMALSSVSVVANSLRIGWGGRKISGNYPPD